MMGGAGSHDQDDVVDRTIRQNEAPVHGIEVDIMPDGRLDFDDEVLAGLDIVLASLHDAARQDGRQLTRRCIAALRHPLVSILTHPANRLVGRHDELRARGLVPIERDMIKHVFDPPAGSRIQWPEDPGAHVRRPLRDMVHRERYDMSKYMSNEDVIKYLYSLREATVPVHSASRAVVADEKK